MTINNINRYDGSIIMVTKKEAAGNDEEGFNAVSWLAPFDNYVWLMIVVTIFASAVLYWSLEVLNPESDRHAGKYQQIDPIETLWMLATYVSFLDCNILLELVPWTVFSLSHLIYFSRLLFACLLACLLACLFVCFSAFAGQLQFDPQTAPARLFTFSIAFWALLMCAAYTGALEESSSSFFV
jgi:hypothetical protein